MEHEIVLREYPKLTDVIKKIFGKGIVKKVYISILQFPEFNLEFNKGYDEEKEFERAFNEIEFTKNGIHCNTTSIVIEFVNGKQITFWASEWGGFYNELQQVDL